MMNQPVSNVSELTVSELSGALKRTIEDAFGHVRLRGEISGFRGPHSSGHCYFSLKDENARIDAVIWRGVYNRLRTRPQEGLEVIATGRITTFAGKSSYQIIIDAIEPAGAGALMALLEERKRKLEAEGLFARERKRPLPYLPRVIGVVTSPTGSVIRDILHRLQDRFPRHVLIWPVRVQGETCGDEVAAGLRGFNALEAGDKIPRPDVIIVARGGGSIEDLWGFNDEAVVRAVAESRIPVISAVGHETDWTLIDLVADHRAPTPTGAAEIAVPVRLDLLAGLHDLANRHEDAMLRRFERMRADLRSAARALPTPDEILSAKRQKLDLAAARLPAALRDNARGFENRFVRLGQRLERASPRLAVARARAGLDAIGERPQRALLGMTTRLRPKIDDLSSRLRYLYAAGLRERAERLGSRYALLRSYSHHATLERGFAMVTRTDGALVRSGASLDPGEDVRLTFRDGTRHARIKGGDAPSGPENAADPDSQADSASGSAGPVEQRARRSARKPGRGPQPGQGSLFEL